MGVEDRRYEQTTPIQSAVFDTVAAGHDLVACAETGTGKTAAFLLPLMQRLLLSGAAREGSARILVLAPTRELAVQIEDDVQGFGYHTSMRCAAVFGGVGMDGQEQALKAGVDIVVATPGRLMDHLRAGIAAFTGLDVLVLDEADRMLDMGFWPDVKFIVSQLPTDRPRQTLLFSATMPEEVMGFALEIMRSPKLVQLGARNAPATTITHKAELLGRHEKTAWLSRFLRRAPGPTLVFSATKRGADRLARDLQSQGIRAAALHADRTQADRLRAVEGFKSGTHRVLVATDIAARGLDIDAIETVVNFEVPFNREAYVHRVGRAGRAGATGTAITLVSPDERHDMEEIADAFGLVLFEDAHAELVEAGEVTDGVDAGSASTAPADSAAPERKRRARSRVAHRSTDAPQTPSPETPAAEAMETDATRGEAEAATDGSAGDATKKRRRRRRRRGSQTGDTMHPSPPRSTRPRQTRPAAARTATSRRSAGALFELVMRAALPALALLAIVMPLTGAQRPAAFSVAHRGASAYAPEHTLEAYRLALEQGADYVEQDLGLTRDGVLVCLHDLRWSAPPTWRRYSPIAPPWNAMAAHCGDAGTWTTSRWPRFVVWTPAAGSIPAFAGARVATFQEAIDLVKGRAGLFPELKGPARLRAKGLHLEDAVVLALERNGLTDARVNGRPAVLLQSFEEQSLRTLAQRLPSIPRTFLIGAPDTAARWLTPAGLEEMRAFASGVGPARQLVDARPGLVADAHAAGLAVVPWTFRARRGSAAEAATATADMRRFVDTLEVDGLFTDNPDLFPRTAAR